MPMPNSRMEGPPFVSFSQAGTRGARNPSFNGHTLPQRWRYPQSNGNQADWNHPENRSFYPNPNQAPFRHADDNFLPESGTVVNSDRRSFVPLPKVHFPERNEFGSRPATFHPRGTNNNFQKHPPSNYGFARHSPEPFIPNANQHPPSAPVTSFHQPPLHPNPTVGAPFDYSYQNQRGHAEAPPYSMEKPIQRNGFPNDYNNRRFEDNHSVHTVDSWSTQGEDDMMWRDPSEESRKRESFLGTQAWGQPDVHTSKQIDHWTVAPVAEEIEKVGSKMMGWDYSPPNARHLKAPPSSISVNSGRRSVTSVGGRTSDYTRSRPHSTVEERAEITVAFALQLKRVIDRGYVRTSAIENAGPEKVHTLSQLLATVSRMDKVEKSMEELCVMIGGNPTFQPHVDRMNQELADIKLEVKMLQSKLEEPSQAPASASVSRLAQWTRGESRARQSGSSATVFSTDSTESFTASASSPPNFECSPFDVSTLGSNLGGIAGFYEHNEDIDQTIIQQTVVEDETFISPAATAYNPF